MRKGADALRGGRYDEAETHYRRALKLDPTQKSAALFLGRALRAQYRPGDNHPENLAKGKAAISVYEQVLATDPGQDEAFTAVTELYGALWGDSKQREGLLRRATDERVSKAKRWSAYRRLANLELTCARRAEANDPSRADGCAARGLDAVERAIGLGGENEAILQQKVQLLLQRAKVAARVGSTERRAYEREAAGAQEHLAKLRERAQRESEAIPSY